MNSVDSVYKQLQGSLPTHTQNSQPIPAAVVVLWRPTKAGSPDSMELFFAKRADTMKFLPGMWTFPGGRMEPTDTSYEACALREMEEETGVILDESELRYAGEWVTPLQVSKRFVAVFFWAKLPQGQRPAFPDKSDEHSEGAWISPRKALQKWESGDLPLTAPALRICQALLRSPQEPARSCAEAARKENSSTRSWPVVGGIAVAPLRTQTLPPATHTNCYLVGSGEFIIVDPGSADPEELNAFCKEVDERISQGAKPSAIWLTHHHGDHIGGLSHVAERYKLVVHAHPLTAELLKGYPSIRPDLLPGVVRHLEGPLPRRLSVVFSPGHAPGHLCFLEEETRTLIAGDMVASEGTILIDPSEGDMAVYMESLRMLLRLEARMLLPAHGVPVTNPRLILQRYLDHRQKREDKVVASLSETWEAISNIVERAYAETPRALYPLAERSLLSHLYKLRDEGRAEEEKGLWCRLPLPSRAHSL